VVYQATITTAESNETYVGFTATEFKTRWRNHQMSFKHESKRNDTELSKHLWRLKDEKKNFAISWKILAKGKSYSNLTKRCNLCNTEKFYILYKPDMATRNSIFYINRTWQRLTDVMSLYQLAGTGASFSLNLIASSMTNHRFIATVLLRMDQKLIWSTLIRQLQRLTIKSESWQSNAKI